MSDDKDDNVVEVDFRKPKLDINKLIKALNDGFKESLPPALRPNYNAATPDKFSDQLTVMREAQAQAELEASLTPAVSSIYTVTENPHIDCRILETFKVHVGVGLPKGIVVKVRYLTGDVTGEEVFYSLPAFLNDHILKP